MQIGDKVRVKASTSYFYGYEGIVTARDETYSFPVEVDFTSHAWPKPVNFNQTELMVIP